jgi:hypothetical protein
MRFSYINENIGLTEQNISDNQRGFCWSRYGDYGEPGVISRKMSTNLPAASIAFNMEAIFTNYVAA